MVDSGLVKQRTFKNTTGVDALVVTAISQNSATQRAGRAGRLAPGKCFRLFTEATYADLDETTVPEILRCNLAGVILALKAIGIADVSKVDFMDRPENSAFLSAFQTLIRIGAVCPKTAELTDLGQEMAVLPTDPLYSKLLVTALKPEYTQVRDSVTAIVSMLSVENVYY